MDTTKWKLNDDGCSVDSIGLVEIPWLGISLKVWFEVEEGQNWWTPKQFQAFEEFLRKDDKSFIEFCKALEDAFAKYKGSKRIAPSSYLGCLDGIDWDKSHLCIPQHHASEWGYVLLLPETKWLLGGGSSYCLELELLYTNGEIELIQEMSGLWNRIEWFEYYLLRR
jgi:hypothetical protein